MIIGLGLTVIVKVIGNPGHPFRVGLTEIVLTIGDEVLLVAKNARIEPLPDESVNPVLILSFVQVKVAPVGKLVKSISGIVAPAQKDMLVWVVTVGVGLIVTVTVNVSAHVLGAIPDVAVTV